MKKIIAPLFFAAVAAISFAVAQPGPGPQPNPWVKSGNNISYSLGGILAPSSVTGGSQGVGTLNASGLFVNGTTVLINGGALGTPSSGNGANITGVNAATLGGATFASPGFIGSSTPGAGAFTTLGASGTFTGVAATLSGALTYGGVTLSNSVTGTGSMVLSNASTLTGTTTLNGGATALALLMNSTHANGFYFQGNNSGTAIVYGGAAKQINGSWSASDFAIGAVGALRLDAAGTQTFSISGTDRAQITATGINSTAIGATTPSTGAFTTLAASGVTQITNATATNSQATGALIVTGGVGIGGDLRFGQNLVQNAAAGTGRYHYWQTATSSRWTAGATGEAESSGNAGTNFSIARYSDAGAFVAHALYINRATGSADFPGGINSTNIGATTPSSGAFTTLSATTPMGVSSGGTGLASGTSGGILAFTGTTTLVSTGALTAGAPIVGGGAGVAPTSGTRSGNTTQFASVAAGYKTSGNVATWDASGNIQDGGPIAAQTTTTFTPTLRFGGGNTGMVLNNVSGRVIKTGKSVTVQISFLVTTRGSSTGVATIGTLPDAMLTVANSFSDYFAIVTNGAAGAQFIYYGELLSSATSIDMYYRFVSTGVQAQATHSDFPDGTYVSINLTYITN